MPQGAAGVVYAIGAMFYEATTQKIVGANMVSPSQLGLPKLVETLLSRALVANPAGRPADLAALASALEQVASGTAASVPPGGYDVAMSLAPPEMAPASSAVPVVNMPPPSANAAAAPAAPASSKDPFGNVIQRAPEAPSSQARPNATQALAELKARLEADPTPRWVVNKDFMDHGPFNAVELLQQVASHKFTKDHTLRDEVSGQSKVIGEWAEFAPFAEHAQIHREVVAERKAVVQLEKSEKKAGVAKFVVAGVVTAAVLAGAAFWFLQVRGARKDGNDLVDDPTALDLSTDGGLRGKKGAGGGKAGGGGGSGGGGGGYARGGMSYEAAIASNNQEVNMGGGGGGPDLTDGQLSGPMRNATFIGGCGAPNDMKVTVRVAIRMGRAVGVSVYTNPADGAVASCVDRHVRGLAWPAHPKMDSFTTTY
jgi:hypothetical protein